jgi:hypothetical protein
MSLTPRIDTLENETSVVRTPGAANTVITSNGSVLQYSNRLTLSFGSATSTTYSFAGENGLGMYRSAGNQLSFATSSVEALRITSNQRLRVQNATDSMPAYSFINDAATGMYLSALNQLSFATNAQEALRITSNQRLRGLEGTAADPTFSFINDADTGMYRSADNQLSFATSSVEALRITSNWQLRGRDGTVGNPTFSFINSPNAGMYLSAANQLSFATNATERFRVEPNGQIRSVYSSTVGSSFPTTLGLGYLCRAWVNFNGVDATIRASGNVSSITKNGTGDYTINFTENMPDTNYAVIGTARRQTGALNSDAVLALANNDSASINTISSVKVVTFPVTYGRTESDIVNIAVFR